MLPSQNRLRHEQDIKTLFSKGKSVFDSLMRVKYRPNALPVSRFTVVVGSKVSKNAVERNRIRRKIREAIRERLPGLAVGFDVAVFVSPAAKKPSVDLVKALEGLLRKTLLWKKA